MTDDPNDSPTSWPRYKKMALWLPASAHCGCSPNRFGFISVVVDVVLGTRALGVTLTGCFGGR
jgi:hypothetical protein